MWLIGPFLRVSHDHISQAISKHISFRRIANSKLYIEDLVYVITSTIKKIFFLRDKGIVQAKSSTTIKYSQVLGQTNVMVSQL